MALLTYKAEAPPTSIDLALARSELDSVLLSGNFQRAPNLANLLTYICNKYFDGDGERIKEYNIAVEALGRPADFDQKKDSIVRVEAHKLRKRLREYYESDGAHHVVRIEIPSGQYAPQFIRQAVEPVPPPVSPRPVPRIAILAAGLVLLAGIVYWQLSRASGISAVSTQPFHGQQQNSGEIRILSGVTDGTTYVDGFGRVWQSDQFFQGGSVFHAAGQSILGTRDPRIYQSRREGKFSYHIPLKPGVYELRLHFAETHYGEGNPGGGGESTRMFRVVLNGAEILHDFDVISDSSGADTADIRVFKDVSPAADGKLHLRFEPGNNPPILSAIEITPGVAGGMQPIRILAADHAYTGKDGRYWAPDRHARGGRLMQRNDDVTNAPDPELYRGERFGNITYVVPVAPGRYGITFHFSETWFGNGQPGAGGVGNRVFHILCNGVALRRNFDIYKEAGGPRRVITWTAHDLEPNHQGKLVISLAPVANYACINALEIFDEPKEQ